MRFSKFVGLTVCVLLSSASVADDTASVDAIIDAYYEVISGPVGFVYDADRDEKHSCAGRRDHEVFLDGTIQQHDFKTEQASIVTPYETPFFEFEVDRKIAQFGNIAHVWSEFEMKTEPEVMLTAVASIASALLFLDGRWWISQSPTTSRTLQACEVLWRQSCGGGLISRRYFLSYLMSG